MLTKAYFDSKIYQDSRAAAAANYAFDISKIYGNQQITNELKLRNGGGGGLDHDSSGRHSGEGNNNNGIEKSASESQQQNELLYNHSAALAKNAAYESGPSDLYQGEFRRPLSVIFWPE